MLSSFDESIEKLSTIELHPTLQIAVNTNHSNGRVIDLRNLKDTLPIAKEKAWAEKCLQAHQSVSDYVIRVHAFICCY